MAMILTGVRLSLDGSEVKTGLREAAAASAKAGQEMAGSMTGAAEAMDGIGTAAKNAQERVDRMTGVITANMKSARASALSFQSMMDRPRSLVSNAGYEDEKIVKFQKQAAAAREAEQRQLVNDQISRSFLPVQSGKSGKDSASAFEQRRGGFMSERARSLAVYTTSDVISSLASNINPAMIAMQQGPQVMQELILSGARVTPAMIAVGASITVAAGAVTALAVAGLQANANMTQMVVATQGLGASAGISAGQLERIVQSSADLGDVSTGAARKMALAYVSTGNIGQRVMGDLISVTRAYGQTVGLDATKATEVLAKAFADPAKGVAQLNDQLHFLDAAQLRYVQNMANAGQAAEAQKFAIDRLRGSLLTHEEAVNGIGSAWDIVARKAADYWDQLGKSVYRAMGGLGPAAEAIKTLQAQRADLSTNAERFTPFNRRKVAELDGEIARLQNVIRLEDRRQQNARDNERSIRLKTAIDQANPNLAQMDNLRSRIAVMKDGLENAPPGTDLTALRAALAATEKQLKDLGDGWTTASMRAKASGASQRDAAEAAREALRLANERARQDENQFMIERNLAERLARLKGDTGALDYLSREMDYHRLINGYLQSGLSLLTAKANAQRDLALLAQAEAEGRNRPLIDDVAKIKNIVPQDAKPVFNPVKDALKGPVSEGFKAGLVDGMMGGSFFETFAQRLRQAAASSLADALTEAFLNSSALNIFRGGSGAAAGAAAGGIFGAIKNFFMPDVGQIALPFAKGTNYAPGGMALVGEQGPELINLPRGSKVYDAKKTAAMTAGAGAVSVSFAPVYHVQGSGEEISALRAAMQRDQASFTARVTAAVNDGMNRRSIRAA